MSPPVPCLSGRSVSDRLSPCSVGRSMGIVLPPVQHTSFRRTHHRNRSLDSVLQEIPELEAAEETALKPALSCPRVRRTGPAPVPPPPAVPARLTGEDASSLGSTDSGISSDGSERDFRGDAEDAAAASMASSPARAGAAPPADCDAPPAVTAVTAAVTVMAVPAGAEAAGDAKPSAQKSWLLRLFESKLFDMSIAVNYLFNSKEPGVQTYIGEWSAAATALCCDGDVVAVP